MDTRIFKHLIHLLSKCFSFFLFRRKVSKSFKTFHHNLEASFVTCFFEVESDVSVLA